MFLKLNFYIQICVISGYWDNCVNFVMLIENCVVQRENLNQLFGVVRTALCRTVPPPQPPKTTPVPARLVENFDQSRAAT